MFHNIAPLKFSEFVPYFFVLVSGFFTALPQLKFYGISWFSKKHLMDCGFNLFADLKSSVAKNCKCFWWILISSWPSFSCIYCKLLLMFFMSIFQSKFRFSATEHPYKNTIVKRWNKGLASINVRNFLILCKTHNLYDAFLQRFSIWISNVSLLSMVIPKRTILSLKKI